MTDAYTLFHEACALLQKHTTYPKGECEALIAGLLEWHWGLKRLDVLVKKSIQATEEELAIWYLLVGRLLQYEPLQHITQEVEFLGYVWKVSSAVLIPRPETEEWTQAVIARCKELAYSPTHIVDICTGSGCVGVSLALAFPQARTWACDLSPDALAVGKRNAARLGAEVQFAQVDVLQASLLEAHLADLAGKEWLLVSNPPYIPQQESASMQRNVLDYEPSMALFVPDASPLVFYERLAYLASRLRPRLFAVEIHENFAEEVRSLFVQAGYPSAVVHTDFHGKARWVEGVRE